MAAPFRRGKHTLPTTPRHRKRRRRKAPSATLLHPPRHLA
jgi:hypothetical protein